MSTLFIIVTFIFILVPFLSGELQVEIGNPFVSYFYLQGKFILDNLMLFILFFFGGVLFYYFSKKRKISLINIIQRFIVVLLLSSLGSIVLLFFIAIVQLNAISILLNLNSNLTGVERDAEVISERLMEFVSPPTVVVGSEDDGTLLPAIALAQSGKDTFYGSKIIRSIPKFLTIPVKKKGSGALMVADTLIISRVSSTDFQKISPVVSYLFIKNYFPEENVKKYPKVTLMNKSQYQKYRQEDYKKKVGVLGEIVEEIKDSADDLVKTVARKEEELASSSDSLGEQKSEREGQYNKCVNEGFYENNVYTKINTKEECRKEIVPLDESISELGKNIQKLEDGIQKDSNTLSVYREYVKYYESQKVLTEQSTGFISFEFAAFEPPDKIQIALTEESNYQEVADFFVLLVHEYLHYSTFNEEGDRLATDFFTEGLTEFFARNIIKSNLGVETNIAYPVNVKIIEQFNKRISESDLADVYFENDEKELKELMDRVYGEGFYERNQLLLETLHYSGDVEKILDIANSVMEEIGGENLDKEDTKTTYTSYE